MEQNKTRTYVKYAIGEITLVMIGILLALQVNNWNENRIKANLEQYLLKELKNEVSENLILINADIQTNSTGLEHSLSLLERIVAKDLDKDQELADSLIAGMYSTSSFEAKSGIITDIINTGKLDVIRSDSLRILISNWDFQIIDMMDDAQIRDVMLFEQLHPYLAKHYPILNSYSFSAPYLASSKMSTKWEGLESVSSPNYDQLYMLEAQGLLYNHAINQEYLLSALRIYKSYLEGLRDLIEEQLNNG
jgi:hypothetical protein